MAGQSSSANYVWPNVAASIVLLAAVLEMPSGYYMLLRWIVCSVLVWHSYRFYLTGSDLMWVTGSAAVLYNPIFPIYLYDKGLWTIINIATVALLFWSQSHLKRSLGMDTRSNH